MKMRMSRVLVVVCSIALWFTLPAAAQHTNGYLFGGLTTIPGETGFTYWHGNYIHAGGGGEKGIGKHFTLAGEAGALISTAANYNRNSGLVSIGPGFHFLPRAEHRLDPYVTGGGAVLVSNGVGGMWYVGGGTNYWFHERIGLKVEMRAHMWSPESGTRVNFVGVRAGICFR